MKLYESIAQQTIKEIKTGRLPVGTRLPALRVLAKQQAVSMSTATNAYRYLEETGWIYSQPQSGFYVSNMHTTCEQPLMQKFKGRSRDPKAFAPALGYSPTVDFFSPLGTSMIAPQLLPTIELQRSIKRITSRSHHTLFDYPVQQGNPILRKSLSNHFRGDHFHFRGDDLVITNGCIDAIRIAIEVVSDVGDSIAISSPCFSGLLDLLATLSRKTIEIPSNEKGLDLDRLEQLMKNNQIKAGLFNTTHMNPSGTSLSKDQKIRLAELANQYSIPIIEDDVYIELSHQGKPPLPVKYWDKNGYVLWCGSVSKTLAAGLRIGWCLPGRYLETYAKQHQLTGLGVNGLMQACVAEFINTGEYRSHVNKTRMTLTKHVYDYRQFLIQNLPSNARVSVPEGGIVLWVQIPELDASRLEQAARNNMIDIRSGSNFSTHKFYKDCFRVNFGWPLDQEQEDSNDTNVALQQLTKLCHMADKYIN